MEYIHTITFWTAVLLSVLTYFMLTEDDEDDKD